MDELNLAVLVNIFIFMLFPFIGGYIANRLKFPSILGYIISGVILGSFFGNFISHDFLIQAAGLGIVLLLFTVGLELNLQNLRRFGKFVIKGGAWQMIISAALIFALTLGFRFSGLEALVIAVSFALSSTALVSRMLIAGGDEDTLLGSMAIGILILQDLVAIPIIILISSLTPDMNLGTVLSSLAHASIRAAVVLVVMYFVGLKFVPRVFSRVAKVSREVLNLFTILFIIASVAVFSYLGLSPSVAAFIAGLLVGQTLQHYHIFSQIRPLRDLFAALFFVSLGAQVTLGSVFSVIVPVMLLTFLVLTIKENYGRNNHIDTLAKQVYMILFQQVKYK